MVAELQPVERLIRDLRDRNRDLDWKLAMRTAESERLRRRVEKLRYALEQIEVLQAQGDYDYRIRNIVKQALMGDAT